jgi:hypothetical protein
VLTPENNRPNKTKRTKLAWKILHLSNCYVATHNLPPYKDFL